jgi:hypothetical protein
MIGYPYNDGVAVMSQVRVAVCVMLGLEHAMT